MSYDAMVRRSCLKAGLLVGLTGLSKGLTSTALARVIPNADPKAIAETQGGRLRGTIADGIHLFRGVPYGTPTGTNARFHPAQKASSWSGVREALAYGPMSPQQLVQLDGGTARPARDTMNLIPVFATGQSEDCLNLNIWTPAVGDGGKRPVMVWLHPGGFEFGDASLAFSEGTNLARRGDVVIVSINQRLGALAHLDLSEIAGPAYARSGNIGMLDLVLGLEWVRDNISAFGGNPDCVTIFGESGGGRKVSTLLAMPGAKGLFHRAIVQSGPAIRFPSNETQAKRAAYLFEALGLAKSDIGRLADIPAKQIVAAGVKAAARVKGETPSNAPFYENYGFSPMTGSDLPDAPFDPSAPGVSADVPLLIGSNRHELSLAYTQDKRFDDIDEVMLRSEARARAGEAADGLIATYRAGNPGASPRDLMLILTADFSHRMDSITIAERKGALNAAPVYMYRFDWEAPVLEGLIKAAHTFEIPLVFNNAQLCSGMTGGGSDAMALAATMSTAWINFARSGRPTAPQLPAWPAYEPEQRQTMIFNDVCALQADPGRDERIAWRQIEKRRPSAQG
jgi:para-nitrobenzyl esterase